MPSSSSPDQLYLWKTIPSNQLIGYWLILAIPVVILMIFSVIRLGRR